MIGPALKQEIENTFQVVTSRCTPDELVIVCPEPGCGDVTGNRSINLKTGRTYCWRCNKGQSGRGSFLNWAKANGYRFSNELGMSSVDVETVIDSDFAVAASVVPYVAEIELPEGFTRLKDEPKCGYARLIEKMAIRKRLSLKDFIRAGAGFTRKSALWEPYCIFPVYELGRVVYYQGRTYTDIEGQTTKRFPSRNEVRHGAASWVYNYDEITDKKANIVIVVESILNVLSLKNKLKALNVDNVVPVCVFKHAISKIQMIKLTRCSWLQEICLMFDHDAIATTWKQTAQLGNRVTLTVAEMPEINGNRKLDPNDNVDAAWDAFLDRKVYTATTEMDHALASPTSVNLEMHNITFRSLR